MDKALDNTRTEDVINTTPSVKIVGDPDVWKLVCKASGNNY